MLRFRTSVFGICFVLSVLASFQAFGTPSGITGRTLKSSTPGCTCHTSSTSTTVTLTITGPATLTPGQTGNYSVVMSGSAITGGGINIAASTGTLASNDSKLKLSGTELTQVSAQSGSAPMSWNFKYTAPATAGNQTLYATGCRAKNYWNHAPNFTVTVSNPVPSLSITAPVGAENWLAGSVQNITWSSANVTNLKLEYTTDNGTSWTVITASTAASLFSYSWTVPNTPSASCKVRLTDASNATVIASSPNTFTISAPAPQITWQQLLTIADAGAVQSGLTFGTGPSATNGVDPLLGETSLPPVPPAGVFDVRFELPITPADYSLKDFRSDTVNSAVWTMRFQPGAGGYPVTISWSSASLPVGSFMLKDLITGTIVNVDMKTQNSYTVTNSAISALKIVYTKSNCMDVTLLSGWNLLSVPLQAADMTYTVIFPGANSQPYGYNNGYSTVSTLATGKGYWLRYPAAGPVSVCGTQVSSASIPVVAGWNIIGGYANDVPVTQLTTTPAGILNSSFYGYNNGYVTASSLAPGKGYWIRATQAGVINLAASAKGSVTVPTAQYSGSITIGDAAGNSGKLYISRDESIGDLPPVPPAGVFDVRFNSQRNTENVFTASKIITISGAAYPLSLRAEGIRLIIKDAATGVTLMNGTLGQSSVTISNPAVQAVEVVSVDKADEFALLQNYPNPFNPSTMISYRIPEKMKVTLRVHNQLGQLVAVLADAEQEAGAHSVTWSASGIPSGVYFYELTAGSYSATKKLLLMK